MPDAQACAVDLNHLARYTGGDTTLDTEVLQLFMEQSQTLLLQLHGVLEARDQKNWRDIIHALKGAARGIGAFPLADAAQAAEFLLLAENPAGATAALRTLATQTESVRRFIMAHLGR